MNVREKDQETAAQPMQPAKTYLAVSPAHVLMVSSEMGRLAQVEDKAILTTFFSSPSLLKIGMNALDKMEAMTAMKTHCASTSQAPTSVNARMDSKETELSAEV